MNTRDEVLREFGYCGWCEAGICSGDDNKTASHNMADEIVKLREQLQAVTQERDEDQDVIAAWRGRTVRAERWAKRWKKFAKLYEDLYGDERMVHAMRVEALNDATERAEQVEHERDELREQLALVKVALPDMKFAAWLLLHASTQKVNEHRSMADSASIITQHIERIEESFKKTER